MKRLILGVLVLLLCTGYPLVWRVVCWVVGEPQAMGLLWVLGRGFDLAGEWFCRRHGLEWQEVLAECVCWGLEEAELALDDLELVLTNLSLALTNFSLFMGRIHAKLEEMLLALDTPEQENR